MSDLSRRCGCRDDDGKQYGARCAKPKSSRHGTWGYGLSAGFDPKTGKRRYVSEFGFDSERAARTAQLDAEKKLHAGSFKFEKRTVGEYIRTWFARAVKTGELKPSTAYMYAR